MWQYMNYGSSVSRVPLKWNSNHREVLSNIPQDHKHHTDFLDLEETSVAKTFGVRWKADTDEFFFVPYELDSKPSLSKREVV